jgi:hypothetical protein
MRLGSRLDRPIALDVSDDESEAKGGQIVLALHFSIDSDEDIEGLRGQPQKFTILNASPACFRDRFYDVAREGVFELCRQALV